MNKLWKLWLIIVLCLNFPALAFAGETQIVVAQKIVGTAKNYLQQNIMVSDYTLELKSKLSNQTVPRGKLALQIKPLKEFQGGNVSVPVQILVAGKRYTTVFVTFELKIYQQVAVTSQSIKQGEILDSTHVQLKRSDVSRLLYQPYSDLSLLLGQRAVRYLPFNAIVAPKDVEPVPWVRKNMPVTLQVQVGAVQITSLVKALQDGSLGDWIQVENLETKKKIYALVIDNGVVEIKKN